MDKQICLLGATFETNNLGVSALTISAIQNIYRIEPDARVIIFDYLKSPRSYEINLEDGMRKVELINISFSKHFYQQNHILYLLILACFSRILPWSALRRLIIEKNLWLREMNRSDLVASISVGDSFSDLYGMVRFAYLTLPQILAVIMKKRMIILPQTIGPFRRVLTKRCARFILGKAERVFSRDWQGVREVRDILLHRSNGKVGFCYDIAFSLRAVKPRNINSCITQHRNVPLIGINVSGLLYIGGYTRNNMFGLKTQYPRLITAIIDYCINQLKASVLLIPHVYGTKKNSESDYLACSLLYDQLSKQYGDRIAAILDWYDQNEMKYIIGLCDFFIGSRLHACISGLSQAVTAVGVSYSPKFLGVYGSLQLEELVVDLKQATEQEIMEKIAYAFRNREAYKRRLQEIFPHVEREITDSFASILKL